MLPREKLKNEWNNGQNELTIIHGILLVRIWLHRNWWWRCHFIVFERGALGDGGWLVVGNSLMRGRMLGGSGDGVVRLSRLIGRIGDQHHSGWNECFRRRRLWIQFGVRNELTCPRRCGWHRCQSSEIVNPLEDFLFDAGRRLFVFLVNVVELFLR